MPDVVVTYDEHGGYGHPDHIQAHRVTCAALASVPAGERPLLYAVAHAQDVGGGGPQVAGGSRESGARLAHPGTR